MVHCNNCTSDLDAWVNLFGETADALGAKVRNTDLYHTLYNAALSADADWDGLVSYNYFGGEPITGIDEGRPLLARMPDAKFTLPNFMRNLLFSAMGTLKIGMDILTVEEGVQLTQLLGHGGLFKTKGVAQKLMAAALNVSVAVMESAGEGGAWGIALLAAYMAQTGKTLDAFLSQDVFSAAKAESMAPDAAIRKDFEAFMTHYTRGLVIEKAAVANLR
jgi:sugar (pentulose or hexulose) kinase